MYVLRILNKVVRSVFLLLACLNQSGLGTDNLLGSLVGEGRARVAM